MSISAVFETGWVVIMENCAHTFSEFERVRRTIFKKGQLHVVDLKYNLDSSVASK